MRIFHFFAVHPVKASFYAPAVLEHREFFVTAYDGSVVEAFDQIRGFDSVIGAAEVWGKEVIEPSVLAMPVTQMTRRESLQRHQDWQACGARGYTLVHRGPESINRFIARSMAQLPRKVA